MLLRMSADEATGGVNPARCFSSRVRSATTIGRNFVSRERLGGFHDRDGLPCRYPVQIPGSSRSVFRDDGDHCSEVMAISIPTSSRSAFRDDRDQMGVVLAV